MAHHPDYVADLLITECVLRDASGVDREAKHLQAEHVIVENIRGLRGVLRFSANL